MNEMMESIVDDVGDDNVRIIAGVMVDDNGKVWEIGPGTPEAEVLLDARENAADTQGKLFCQRSRDSNHPQEKTNNETMAKVCETKSDQIRAIRDRPPETQEVQDIQREEVENNPLTRFERLKDGPTSFLGSQE